MRGCLSVDELAGYAGGGSLRDADGLDVHVDRCEPCRRAVVAAIEANRMRVGAPARHVSSAAATEPARGMSPGRGSGELPIREPRRYARIEEIARGGMGRIVRADDLELGRSVAIKELGPASAGLAGRFEREVRITARLQHPAIIPVHEAGRWPNGEPFYAMKLVSGESLDTALARRGTLDARMALLPNVIAVADALAYAHSIRVIHRDLKPANVLVGEYGETVVIDWGLAKDLSDPLDASDVAVGPYRAAGARGDETQDGVVMGTPAYMPPEQASGAAVDERADVYALGAMLYHLLSGAPPYTAKTSDHILAQVLSEPPPRIDAKVSGVPRDLAAIVHTAMAREPARRYPSARELADDLKRFQTGQLVAAHRYSVGMRVRRWLRRHRAAVAVAGLSTLVLVVLGVVGVRRILDERREAERQRRVAERNRADAEQLVRFVLIDLRDRLRPRSQLDVLDEAVKRSVAYYQRKGAPVDALDRSNRAVLQVNLGDVLRAQGDSDGALDAYRTARAEFEVLAASLPGDNELRRSILLTTLNIGDVASAQADLAGAEAAYRAALIDATSLAARDRADPQAQQDLAVTHGRLGAVLQTRGDTSAALDHRRQAVAVAEALVASAPDNPEWKSTLVDCQLQLGEVLSARGERTRAAAMYSAVLAAAQQLAQDAPNNDDRQALLASAHQGLGDALFDDDKLDRAEVEYRASVAIAETLARRDPGDGARQVELALVLQRLGEVVLERGDAKTALATYERSLDVARPLAAGDPSDAHKQQLVADGFDGIGQARAALGDTDRALAAYREALAIEDVLAVKNRRSLEPVAAAAAVHADIGTILLSRGDAAGAVAEHLLAKAMRERLAGDDPLNIDNHLDLATSLRDLGDARAAGKDDRAYADYGAARDIVATLAAQDPDNADVRELATQLAAPKRSRPSDP